MDNAVAKALHSIISIRVSNDNTPIVTEIDGTGHKRSLPLAFGNEFFIREEIQVSPALDILLVTSRAIEGNAQ
jgi:hypothetical protein